MPYFLTLDDHDHSIWYLLPFRRLYITHTKPPVSVAFCPACEQTVTWSASSLLSLLVAASCSMRARTGTNGVEFPIYMVFFDLRKSVQCNDRRSEIPHKCHSVFNGPSSRRQLVLWIGQRKVGQERTFGLQQKSPSVEIWRAYTITWARFSTLTTIIIPLLISTQQLQAKLCSILFRLPARKNHYRTKVGAYCKMNRISNCETSHFDLCFG